MQRNTGYFPTESLEPCGNRLFSRSALNEGYLFRGSLGNLLDNALEACRKLPDSSYINVKILKKEGDFLLSVENSSLPVKISENNYVPTDKAEPRLHGFGLQNIAHIMQKYGYEYTLFYHDARFHFVSILS